MELKDIAMVVINRPPKQVWQAICSLDRWSSWSGQVQEGWREGRGWHVGFRGKQGINLRFGLRVSVQTACKYLEFETDAQLDHNASLRGWVSLEAINGSTSITFYAEGCCYFDAVLQKQSADRWSVTLVDSSLDLKQLLHDLKNYVENQPLARTVLMKMKESHA